MHTSDMLPLPALVGLDTAQQALLLLAVEPRLGGIVFASPAGAGKSSLARGARSLYAGSATKVPFVEMPISADEESLLGGLDIEATLRLGRRVLRDGILSRADHGLVYVDQLNLLTDTSANLILSALDSGEVRVERESISLRSPARFSLIGSYDPSEGAPRRHLLDRVGLLVILPGTTAIQQRAEVVRRNLRAEHAEWEDELAMMQGLVQAAREQLPDVTITDEQIGQLAATALAFGVEGHRVDLFAVHAACAAAALGLRESVDQADLELALQLVIMPRATRIPTPPPEEQQSAAEDQPSPPDTSSPPPESEEEHDPETQTTPDLQIPEEQVFSALASELPEDLTEMPFRTLRRGRSGSRGTTSGTRGRHVRSTPGDPRRARIDITATLRTAAPWQRLRESDARRSSVIIQADDLRVKHFRAKAGALFCFAVDASGSMALHRMRQAKGAVHTLLQTAYVHRDRVALLAFRGDKADLLLPPSQSVELARRALDLLPTGGGTPLAAALLGALDVAEQARSRGIMQTVLVLLTDGRANIGLRAARGGVTEELQVLGRHVAESGIQSVVVDTQRSYLSRGEARRLAEWLGGTYVYLPNARGEQIADAALAARDGNE